MNVAKLGLLGGLLLTCSGALTGCWGSTATTCADGIGCAIPSAGNAGNSGQGASSAQGGSSGGSGSLGRGGSSGSSGRGGGSGSSGEAGMAEGGLSGAAGAAPCNDACSGSKPECELTTNTCVECLARKDCKSTAEPACDAATHGCVECLVNADCKSVGKSACDAQSQRCVECVESSDCTDSARPFCEMTTQACVACLKQADCTTASTSACNAGQCKPCALDAECLNIGGKGVCDAGTCVECTGKKFSACGQSAGTPQVCDSLQRTCTTSKEHSSGLCQACTSDAQCNLGELCVLDKIGSPSKDVGYFCHWKQGDVANGAPGNCSLTGMPYVKTQVATTSIDGETSDLCALRTSTCVANNQFSDKDCAVGGAPSDALCGVSPPKDATCALYNAAANTYRCTMTCLSDDDCPGTSCNIGVTPRVCNLN